jgi:hypothetical protein
MSDGQTETTSGVTDAEANSANELSMDRISRLRRSVFSFGTMAICLLVPSVLALLRFDNPLSANVVNGFIGLAQIVVLAYLTAGSVDRSKVLDRLGGKTKD